MPPNVDKTNAPDHIYHGVISAYGKVVDFVATQGVLIEKKVIYETSYKDSILHNLL